MPAESNGSSSQAIIDEVRPRTLSSALEQGLRIGSRAMEVAHRTLIQCRMKHSEQRWAERGVQNLLNLREAYKSGKAQVVRQIITGMAA